ncbi:hypothetical protein SNEBB_002034, partial [Seison nebaliae]
RQDKIEIAQEVCRVAKSLLMNKVESYGKHVWKKNSTTIWRMRGELPVPTGRKREKGKGEEKEEN